MGGGVDFDDEANVRGSFNVISEDGWSSFPRSNWQFAEDFDALSADAGVRYVW